VRWIRTVPLWALPLLAVSALAASVAFIILVPYFAVVGLAIGAVAVAKDARRAPAEYQKLHPTKAWDGVFAWLTVRDIPCFLRIGLLGAAISAVTVVFAAADTDAASRGFAWGFLAGVATGAGVESFMRHREVLVRAEFIWVALECMFIATVALARPADWLIGIAAALSLEVAGFMAFFGIALSRVQTATRQTQAAPEGAAL